MSAHVRYDRTDLTEYSPPDVQPWQTLSNSDLLVHAFVLLLYVNLLCQNRLFALVANLAVPTVLRQVLKPFRVFIGKINARHVRNEEIRHEHADDAAYRGDDERPALS